MLAYKPFLIKPNNHELGEIFGVEVTDKDDVIKSVSYTHLDVYKRQLLYGTITGQRWTSNWLSRTYNSNKNGQVCPKTA